MAELTRQQFCAVMGISESTCRRMEQQGLPYTPVGKRGKRYDLVECKRWLRENLCQSGRIPTAAGMLASWSREHEFTASCRKVHLRVKPGASKQKSEAA